MNDTKHNPPAAGQDSDDLIAELARLVAQDARTAAAPPSTPRREEPAFRHEPQFEAPAEPVEPEQDDYYEAEDSFGATDPYQPESASQPEEVFEPQRDSGQGDIVPVFDFGFGTAQQTGTPEGPASDDPIADLIADAEVEAYDRDYSQDEWAEHDDPLPAEAEPVPVSYEGYERADETFSGGATAGSERGSDPLHDIEALIGEAARANSGDGGLPAGRRVKSSFLDDDKTDAAVDAAESAILAAAAATGAPLRHVEPASDPEDWLVAPAPRQPETRQAETRTEPAFEPHQPAPQQFIPDPLFAAPVQPRSETEEQNEALEYEDEDYVDDGYGDDAYAAEEMEPRRARRQGLGAFVVPVAAGAVILALIGGAYFAFFSGPGEPGEAPVLTADSGPLKEEATPTPNESAASDSVVFSEIEGNSASPDDEELVSRDQTNGASGAQVAQALAPEDGETALANRPVRTVTVRPDGTIVQADDSVAGSNVLPVERPDVPAVPNSTLTADPIGEAIAQAMAGDAGAEPANPAPVAETVDAAPVAGAADATETAQTAVTAPSTNGNAPVPIARPAGLSGQTSAASTPAAAPATETVAAATPAPATPAPAAAAATPAANVGAWVQLSSQRSEADAQADIPSLQSRYGSLFNGATPEVSQVDLGERGIYYRVRLPQPSFDQANSVCTAIQGQGGDCFVLNN